ncbi:AAA family ATPase [Methanomethylophilus alvi]|uniref:AAA family ATPase n=1 Tax=Methanomethylophilus alvi TaxID=1291540 RepID=UPI0037DC287E
MLRRKIYSELLKWKNEPFKEALFVKGARQVGKSFIIEQFIKENFERHLTIDFV